MLDETPIAKPLSSSPSLREEAISPFSKTAERGRVATNGPSRSEPATFQGGWSHTLDVYESYGGLIEGPSVVGLTDGWLSSIDHSRISVRPDVGNKGPVSICLWAPGFQPSEFRIIQPGKHSVYLQRDPGIFVRARWEDEAPLSGGILRRVHLEGHPLNERWPALEGIINNQASVTDSQGRGHIFGWPVDEVAYLALEHPELGGRLEGSLSKRSYPMTMRRNWKVKAKRRDGQFVVFLDESLAPLRGRQVSVHGQALNPEVLWTDNEGRAECGQLPQGNWRGEHYEISLPYDENWEFHEFLQANGEGGEIVSVLRPPPRSELLFDSKTSGGYEYAVAFASAPSFPGQGFGFRPSASELEWIPLPTGLLSIGFRGGHYGPHTCVLFRAESNKAFQHSVLLESEGPWFLELGNFGAIRLVKTARDPPPIHLSIRLEQGRPFSLGMGSYAMELNLLLTENEREIELPPGRYSISGGVEDQIPHTFGYANVFQNSVTTFELVPESVDKYPIKVMTSFGEPGPGWGYRVISELSGDFASGNIPPSGNLELLLEPTQTSFRVLPNNGWPHLNQKFSKDTDLACNELNVIEVICGKFVVGGFESHSSLDEILLKVHGVPDKDGTSRFFGEFEIPPKQIIEIFGKPGTYRVEILYGGMILQTPVEWEELELQSGREISIRGEALDIGEIGSWDLSWDPDLGRSTLSFEEARESVVRAEIRQRGKRSWYRSFKRGLPVEDRVLAELGKDPLFIVLKQDSGEEIASISLNANQSDKISVTTTYGSIVLRRDR